jgi:hypothetical protein
MGYTPPVTFAASTVLTAADVQSCVDDLRIYLHKGISVSDLEAAQWVDTRHIQPPKQHPYHGLQHGVTGWQGGLGSPGEGARLTFATKYLTGGGLVDSNVEFLRVPNTSFKVEIRRAAKVLFHWWVEVEAGPDDSTYTSGRTFVVDDRLAFFAPYVSSTGGSDTRQAQEIQTHQEGWGSSYPIGASAPYTVCAGYGQRDGVFAVEVGVGSVTVGLAAHSQIDRVGVVNWNVAIEIFYL